MRTADYPEVPDDFGHWLAGFIDGEGCFVIERRNQRPNSGGFACRFFIGLRDDDEPILTEMTARLGMGTMRYDPPRGQGRGRPQARWSINTRYDCAKLVRLLDRCPLRAKKARDYSIWREAVLYLEKRRPWAHVGWGPMPRLMRELAEVRRYEPPPPRDESDPPLTLWEN